VIPRSLKYFSFRWSTKDGEN